MKYVGQARTNTADNTAAIIKSAVQSAVAEYQGQTGVSNLAACACYIEKDTSEPKSMTASTNAAPTGGKSLEALIKENLGSDTIDQNYGVTISANGTVKVTKQGTTATAPSVPS